jgi:hypothetical protein
MEGPDQPQATTGDAISNQNQGKNLIINYLSPDVQENGLWVMKNNY